MVADPAALTVSYDVAYVKVTGGSTPPTTGPCSW